MLSQNQLCNWKHHILWPRLDITTKQFLNISGMFENNKGRMYIWVQWSVIPTFKATYSIVISHKSKSVAVYTLYRAVNFVEVTQRPLLIYCAGLEGFVK